MAPQVRRQVRRDWADPALGAAGVGPLQCWAGRAGIGADAGGRIRPRTESRLHFRAAADAVDRGSLALGRGHCTCAESQESWCSPAVGLVCRATSTPFVASVPPCKASAGRTAVVAWDIHAIGGTGCSCRSEATLPVGVEMQALKADRRCLWTVNARRVQLLVHL